MTTPAIPVIYLDRDTALVAKEIGDACERHGFYVITGHGVPASALNGLFDVTREFFAQPLDVKREASTVPPDPYCGYTDPEDQWADGSVARQLEKFEACTFNTREDMAAAGYEPRWADLLKPNVWPRMDGFRQAWRRYLTEMHTLGDRLMGLMSLALDLPVEYLPDLCAGACSFLVANHYLPAPGDQPVEEFRLRAHTDIEALTVLWRPGLSDGADEGGIQVHVRAGAWEDVPVVPDSFVINLGDMMAHWTDGRYKATPHRVRNGGERWSFPFFHGPRKDVVLQPIPSCAVPGQAPKWKPVAAGVWTDRRMASLSRNGEVSE